jgi:hypothetical protein
VPVRFTDQAATVAIGEDGAVGHTWSAAVADFNGDGHSDVFVSHHGDPGRLWITQIGGTFTEIDQRYFSGLDRHDCEALDANRDGLVDLFCSVGADRGTGLKSNALYLQNADRTFSDQAYQWAVSDPEGRGALQHHPGRQQRRIPRRLLRVRIPAPRRPARTKPAVPQRARHLDPRLAHHGPRPQHRIGLRAYR